MTKWFRMLCALCLCTLLLAGCGNPTSPSMTQGTEPAVSPQGDVGPPDKTQAPTPAQQDDNGPQNTTTPAQ